LDRGTTNDDFQIRGILFVDKERLNKCVSEGEIRSAASFKNSGAIWSGPGDLFTSNSFKAEQTSEQLICLKTNSLCHKLRSASRKSTFELI